jgi:hypothetical protein
MGLMRRNATSPVAHTLNTRIDIDYRFYDCRRHGCGRAVNT